MKAIFRLLVLALSVGLLSTCAAEDTISVHIAKTDTLDEGCAFGGDDEFISRGSINLAVTRDYILALHVVNETEDTETDINKASRNNFFVQEISFSYSGQGVHLPDKTVSQSATITPGGGVIDMKVYPLGQQQADALLGSVGDGLDLTVTIKMSGEFANGTKYTTAPFDFTIKVINDEACATSLLGPCGNIGQDDAIFGCH